VYYLLERHWWTKLYPPAYVPPEERRAAWWNTALLAAYAIALLTFLAASPAHATNLTPLRAVLLGFVLPQSIFETLDGFALYVQHTDPRIPWFREEPDREAEGRTELLSAHLIVPRPMGWFFHDTFSHPVHHLLPKIPCYRSYAAQCALDRRLGPAAVTSRFGPRWFLDTTRRCKLYDWDNHRWLDFDGNPTTAPIAAARPGGRRGGQAALPSGAPAGG
jgi:omega-6 fatty acid desaturase (delta-12 desaturase)